MLVQPWTYRNKSPVAKVIDCAEEPEFVEEKIGSCHGALVWKRQGKTENEVKKMNLYTNRCL